MTEGRGPLATAAAIRLAVTADKPTAAAARITVFRKTRRFAPDGRQEVLCAFETSALRNAGVATRKNTRIYQTNSVFVFREAAPAGHGNKVPRNSTTRWASGGELRREEGREERHCEIYDKKALISVTASVGN